MDARDRWQKVERLYHEALERDERSLDVFLQATCGADEALRRDVESLLAYAGHAQRFMVAPALEVAAPAMTQEPEPATILANGIVLGPYTIVAPIGAGGMGEVYRAHDARLGRDVAVKVLPRRVTRDPAGVERFSREARAASALNHPNIVTIHEIGESEHGRFIVMELVHGQMLRKRIGQPFTLQGFCTLGTQVAQALAVAHVAGIVHRDVKPENIMVRDDGYVKLLDFGLARLAQPSDLHHDTETTAPTTVGTVVGTLPYMSPEQVRGEPLSSATDVFSLGIVFYELATGQRPFRASSSLGVMHAILSESPHPPSTVNPEITRSLDALILSMLEKDAARRPGAGEVEAALSESAGVLGAAPKRLGIDTIRHSVGRAAERADLCRAFDMAASQRGLLVSVTGEAGIGKTTLVEDALAELTAGDRPCRTARGRCSERLAGAEAYLPWLEAFTSLIHHTGHESVAQRMKLVAPTWYRRAAMIEIGDESPPSAEAVSQERMKRELIAFLEEISHDRPLVLFFDDVHWADVSTIELLGYVGARLQGLCVLIVVTYRPSELLVAKHPFVSLKLELQARDICREVPLGFLTREDMEGYLALECPGHEFPPDLLELIQAKTEGNPLFMADLVRHLRHAGVIREERGRWVLTQPVSDAQRELPESMRAMIQKKIAQLSEIDLRLLVGASVQGHEFDSAVVARALDLDAAEVEERLDALQRVHAFITLVGEHEFPDYTPTVRYRFVHVLYQNALYASLRPTRRSSLSAAVGTALVAYHGKQLAPIASQLAALFEVARRFEQAARYFLLAAQQAANVSAHPETVVLTRRGLRALTRLPRTNERAHQELLLHTILGPALMITSGHGLPEVEAVYNRARELCEQVGETPQLFPVVWGLWHYSLVRAEYEPARALAEQLLTWATKLDDPALTLLAHNALTNTLWTAGEFERARRHAECAREIYSGEQHHALASLYAGHDPGVACRAFLALIVWNLGWPDQAVQSAHDAVALARELGHRYSELLALSLEAMLHYHRRDAPRTRQRAEEAMALAAELGMAPWVSWATALRGWAIVTEGDPEAGMTLMHQGIQGIRQIGAVGPLLPFLAMLADACSRTGRPKEGLAAVAEGLAVTERSGLASMEAELNRLQGEMVVDPKEKEAFFRRAIDISQRQHAKSFELRAAMSLNRLYASKDRRSPACQMLLKTYSSFVEGFDTADLKEASAMLERQESNDPHVSVESSTQPVSDRPADVAD